MLVKCIRCDEVHNEQECEFCNGKGVVIPSLALKLEEVKFLALKINHLKTNRKEHYDSLVDYFNDLNEDESIKSEADERINQQIKDELNQLQEEFDKQFILKDKINEITQAEIAEYIIQGYVHEKSHLDICARCTNKNSDKCSNCINNLQCLYIEDCEMNFQSNEQGSEWYKCKGYKLALY